MHTMQTQQTGGTIVIGGNSQAGGIVLNTPEVCKVRFFAIKALDAKPLK